MLQAFYLFVFQVLSLWQLTLISSFPSMTMTRYVPTVVRTWPTWILTFLPWQKKLSKEWPGFIIIIIIKFFFIWRRNIPSETNAERRSVCVICLEPVCYANQQNRSKLVV